MGAGWPGRAVGSAGAVGLRFDEVVVSPSGSKNGGVCRRGTCLAGRSREFGARLTLNVFEMRELGDSGVKVTPVIFGAWAVGGWMWGGNDEADSIAAIRASVDHGVTTIDTAAVYGQGYGEEVVGKAIQGLRDRVQIATKGGMTWDLEGGSDPWATQDRLGHDVTIRRNSSPKTHPHRVRAEPQAAGRRRHRPLPDPLARHHHAGRGHDGRAGEVEGPGEDPGHRREQLRRHLDQEGRRRRPARPASSRLTA